MRKFYFGLVILTLFAVCFGFGFKTAPKIEAKQSAETNVVSPNIVISQFFGGGGVDAASPFRNDFVEIFNRSNAPVSLNGHSIQYSFAGSATWNVTALPNVTLGAGQYYLVQFAQSANGGGAPLPTPDATGTTNMHPINGKLAIVNTTAALSGACPIGATIVDFLGYGTGGCFEGTQPVVGMNITVSAQRNGTGCFDTDQNAADFSVAAPVPRNTSSPTTNCGTVSVPLSGSGSASPSTAAPGATVLFTVRVIPADTPPSTGITVTANFSNIGGSATQQLFDNGTNGDTTAGDNTFSLAYVIPNIFGGIRNVPVVITDAQMRSANTVIVININAPFESDDHILLGNPSNATPDIANENNYLMFKPQYVLSYNRSRATPNWTAWRTDQSWLGSAPRQDDFRPDPALPAGWYQVLDSDYTGSGYNRGHLCPSADRTRSIPDNSATFLMTNMIPHISQANQGPWEDFETYMRGLVTQGNEVYTYMGVLGNAGTIAGGRVVIPAATWKVVLIIPNGTNDLQRISKQTRTIAIIVPNNSSVNINAPWRNFRTSVKAVEVLTGYNFFTNLPINTREIIKRRKDRQ